MAQYGTASFESLIEASEGGTPGVSSGTLVEQIRKQAFLNQQQQDMEMEEDAEWDAYEAMEEAEDEEIHQALLSGSSSSKPAKSSEDDPAAEAKANALALYRAAEGAIREAAMQGGGVDEQNRAAYMAAENQIAREQNVKWRDRGPRGEDAPAVFKGQRWRANSQRYANRGGTRQAEFAVHFASQKAKKGGGKDSKAGKKGSHKSKGGNKGSKVDDS